MLEIEGFSKLTKQQKLSWLIDQYLKDKGLKNDSLEQWKGQLSSFCDPNPKLQSVIDELIENTVCNFYLPFGVAPNFLINSESLCIPMATEESSVVAAISNAAKFWSKRGGITAWVSGVEKVGQVHFYFDGEAGKLNDFFEKILRQKLLQKVAPIVSNMEKRGGGILDVALVDKNHLEKDYYQLMVTFDTRDAMGANFINTVLEEFARVLKAEVENSPLFAKKNQLEVILSILSNYNPHCLAHAKVECPVASLGEAYEKMPAHEFAERFVKAVRIAHIDPYRAVTHNKGIFNGIDAVALATGNDLRAVEACGHAYAAQSGQYRSLTRASLEKDEKGDSIFHFSIQVPLSVGTVGGLTSLHPLAKLSLEMLGRPDARKLMAILASVGLIQNFGALRSLVTTGIQKGHMKMHLANILNLLGANEQEKQVIKDVFFDKVVSFKEVSFELEQLRKSYLH